MADILQLLRFNAKPEKLYEAFTTQNGLSAWWTAKTKAEARVGAMLEFYFDEKYYAKFEVTKLEENKKIEWKFREGSVDWQGTVISFDISQKNSMTFVRFRHGNWKEASDYFQMCSATWGHLLFKLLADYVEEGKRNPYFK
jgi:uncharacterized protein YndB with AHSA1/START domain